MSDSGSSGAKWYRERDERIMSLIRSSEDALREEGWELLEQNLRIPLAIVLRNFAIHSKSGAFDSILDESFFLNDSAFDEIWQYAIACLMDNIQKEGFEFKGNLLAYMTTIAARKIIAQWLKNRRIHWDVDFENFSVTVPENRARLLEVIQQFYKTLDHDDQLALQIGIKLAKGNFTKRANVKKIVKIVQITNVWDGDYSSIARRYVRLRDKLRKHLEEQGYNV